MALDTKQTLLGSLSKDRNANMSALKKAAADDPEFAINSLRSIVADLGAMNPTERQKKYGLSNSDLFELSKLQSQSTKRVPQDEIFEGWYLPGRKQAIASQRQKKTVGLEKEQAVLSERRKKIQGRSALQNIGVAARAAFEGGIAPAMVEEYTRLGLSPEQALEYIDFEDPLQVSAATAGFARRQGAIPSAASVPGNVLGGFLGGAIGTGIGNRFMGGALSGVTGGLGGLAGGIAGAIGTSALGQKYLNPFTRLSKEQQALLGERFAGPERAIGEVLAPAGIFSIKQGPRGARTFFEGEGLRAGMTSLLSRPSQAGTQTVVAPMVDIGSRVVQMFQTQAEISAANEDARQKFLDENGYEGTEEELVPYGYRRPSERLNQAFMDASLGGFGPFGRMLSGEGLGTAVREGLQKREAKRVVQEVFGKPKATPPVQPASTTTSKRVAPFGVIRTAVPSGTGAGQTVKRPVTIAYDEGDKPGYRVKDTTAAMMPGQRDAIAERLKQPKPVTTPSGPMDVVGVTDGGEIFVQVKNASGAQVIQTRTYNQLPPELQRRVDAAARSVTREGAALPQFDAVSDTAYSATQDANPGYAEAFPNVLTVDGKQVRARVLSIDDQSGLAHVKLPSGSTLYIHQAIIAQENDKIDTREPKLQRTFEAAKDDKGKKLFSNISIRGESQPTFIGTDDRRGAAKAERFQDETSGISADASNVGQALELGAVRYGNVEVAERGVIVGVDSWKTNGKDSSGYWVQSVTSPAQPPFLVTAKDVESMLKPVPVPTAETPATTPPAKVEPSTPPATTTVPATEKEPVTTETAAIEPKAEEPKEEESPKEEPKAEEPKVEEPKVEEPKAEGPKVEEPKVEEPKAEEPKVEEPKVEEPKAEEPKAEEPKAEEPEIPEGAVKWPEGYKFEPYGEAFEEVAADEDLPEEMRTAARGGEYYRYRRMTKGEQAKKRGVLDRLPRFVENIKRLTGQFIGQVKVAEKTVDLKVELRKIENREDFKQSLMSVFGQTDAQATALANLTDRFANGWAMEMMRLSGISTQDIYRAVRTEQEKKVAVTIESGDEWKKDFKEQSVIRNDKATLEAIAKLKAYFYSQRLGQIAELSPEASASARTSGFTTSWAGENQTVNVAFALKGERNYVVQTHEVTHLLMKSMYAPMYHELAAAVMPAYQQYIVGKDLRKIDPWVEEKIVTSFLRSLATAEPGTTILRETHQEGGASHDAAINKVLMDVGEQLRQAVEAIRGIDPSQNILGEQGWVTSFDPTATYPQGTSFRVVDPRKIKEGVKEFVLDERWDVAARPTAKFQGYLFGDDGKVTKTSIDRQWLREGDPQFAGTLGVGQIRATMGRPVKEAIVRGKATPVVQTDVIGSNASNYLAKFFGHWSEHTNNLLASVSIGDIGTEEFVPESQVRIERYTFGYQWFRDPTEYRQVMKRDEKDWSDRRILQRTNKSYLGWLDRGGFDSIYTDQEVREIELGVVDDLEVEAGVVAGEGTGSIDKGSDVPDLSLDIDFMSTPLKPDNRRSKRGVAGQITGNIISNYLQSEILGKAKGKSIRDVPQGATRTYLDTLVDKILAMPFVGQAIRTAYIKNVHADSLREGIPYFKSWDSSKRQKQVLSPAEASLLHLSFKKLQAAVREDRIELRTILNRKLKQERNAIERDKTKQFKDIEDALSGKLDESTKRTLLLDGKTTRELRVSAVDMISDYINPELWNGEELPEKDFYVSVKDENGKDVYEVDAKGNQILKPKIVKRLGEEQVDEKTGEPIYVLDSEGNRKLFPVPVMRLVHFGLKTMGGSYKDKIEFQKTFGITEDIDAAWNMYQAKVAMSKLSSADSKSVTDSLSDVRGVVFTDETTSTKARDLIATLQKHNLMAWENGLPLSLVKPTIGKDDPEMARAMRETRVHTFNIEGQEYDIEYTWAGILGQNAESAFRRSYIESKSDYEVAEFDKLGNSPEIMKRVSEYMFRMGYETVSKIEQIELGMAEKGGDERKSLRASYKFEFVIAAKQAIVDELQFVKVEDGGFTRLQLVKDERGRIVGSSWQSITSQELSDSLMSAVYRATTARAKELQRELGSSASIPDETRRDAYKIRNAITNYSRDGQWISASELNSSLETYVASRLASTAWRQGRERKRVSLEDLADQTIRTVKIKKKDVQVPAPMYWSGTVNPQANGNRVIGELAKAIDDANEIAENDMTFRSMVENELMLPKYRDIPAVAEYQNQILLGAGGGVAKEMVPTVLINGRDVSFAAITGESVIAKKAAADKQLASLEVESIVFRSIDDYITADRPEDSLRRSSVFLDTEYELSAEEQALLRVAPDGEPASVLETRQGYTALQAFDEVGTPEFRNSVEDSLRSEIWELTRDFRKQKILAKYQEGEAVDPNDQARLNLLDKTYSEYVDSIERAIRFRQRTKKTDEQALTNVQAMRVAVDDTDAKANAKLQKLIGPASKLVGQVKSMLESGTLSEEEFDIAMALSRNPLVTSMLAGGAKSSDELTSIAEVIDKSFESDESAKAVMAKIAKSAGFDLSDMSKGGGFVSFLEAWGAASKAFNAAERLDMTGPSVIVDTPAVAQLVPNLTLREQALLRIYQGEAIADNFGLKTDKIADLLESSSDTVKDTARSLFRKINDAERNGIAESIQHLKDSGAHYVDALSAIYQTAKSLEASAKYGLSFRDTTAKRMRAIIDVLLNEPSKDTGQALREDAIKQLQQYPTAFVGFVDAMPAINRAIDGISIIRSKDMATFDADGKYVTINETSDSLTSTRDVKQAIRSNEFNQGATLTDLMSRSKDWKKYSHILDVLNQYLEQPRTVLTNDELRAIVLMNRGKNYSKATVAKELAGLIQQRDDAIANPLKEHLSKSTVLDLQSSTIAELNLAMDTMQLSDSDKIAAMSVMLKVATRNNDAELTSFILLNKRLPTEVEYLALGPTYTSQKYQQLEGLQKSIGFNAIVNGMVGTSITINERNKAAGSKVVAFALDVRPQDLPLNEAVAQASIAYQKGMIEEFLGEDNTAKLLQLDAQSLQQALDQERRVNVATSPLRAGTLPGKPKQKAPLVKKLAEPEKNIRDFEIAKARVVNRIIKTGIDAIRNAFDIAELGGGLPLPEINQVWQKVGMRALEAAWTRASAMSAIDSRNRRIIEPALNDFAQAMTQGILDARTAILGSINDRSLDNLSYKIVDPNNNIVVAIDDTTGETVYTIDYNNARVQDASNRLVTIRPMSSVNVPGLGVVEMTRAQKALYDLLSVGMSKEQLELDDSGKRIAESVLANEALRSVPAVYWHGHLRVQSPIPAGNVEPMFLSTPIKNAVDVYNSVGTVTETTRQDYVLPVINKWIKPDVNGQQRVVLNTASEPFFDGHGYTVWREDGRRSHVYAMLINHGLAPSKALEIYALTEHPQFKEWAAGTMVESAMLDNSGSFMDQGRVRSPKARSIIAKGIAAQNLVVAIDRFMANETSSNFDEVMFAYDEVRPDIKQLEGKPEKTDISSQQLAKEMSEIYKSKDRSTQLAIIKAQAENLAKSFSSEMSNSVINSYKAYKDSEQPIRTGKAFHALAFPYASNSFLAFKGKGVGVYDLGSGLHDNFNRKNIPSWVKFENPLVHDAGNSNVDVEIIKDLMARAFSKGHDGVVIRNLADTINSTTTRNVVVSLKEANVLPVARMTQPTKARYVAAAKDVEPMFLSTPMIAPVTSVVVPPLLQGQVNIRKPSVTERGLAFLEVLLDNVMSFARNPLSSDIAFSFIQAGKAGLGIFTGRPQDTVAWAKALWGSRVGLAPNLQWKFAGKSFGYQKLGRRKWIETYLQLRQSDTWEVMKALNVPMHFMNFERKLESERARLYALGQGTIRYEDIPIDMMEYDERGNLDDVFEKNTLIGMMPAAGMYERQMSLQHDLLMFYQVEWQLKHNPEFRDLLKKSDPIDAMLKSQSARSMVNFIANTMGDFQYTTNDRVDVWSSRIGKAFLQAPRWYMANLITQKWVSLVVDKLYQTNPKFRAFVGTNNRSIGLYDHKNKELLDYQTATIRGTMLFWIASSLGALIYGRLMRKQDVDWNIRKGLGHFRIGDWEISESTGLLDPYNIAYGTLQDLAQGGIGTKPRMGETDEEAENAGFNRASQRLGYRISPVITLLYKKLWKGRDALNRNVFRPNEEFLVVYEDFFDWIIKPLANMAGVDVSTPNDMPLSGMILTQQIPAAWQDAWSAYVTAKRENYGDKGIATTIAAESYMWSYVGSRVRYSPFIPDHMKNLYRQQWALKKFLEQQGPTGEAILKNEGLLPFLKAIGTGRP